MDEQAKGKVRNKLKDLISKAIVKGTLSAAFLFASPYIAVSEALGAAGLLSFLEDVLGEELAERIKRKLGARKYSEEDVREIFEMAKKDEDVRESLAKLVNELIDEKLLEELGREKSGYLEAIYQAVDELKKELPDIKERLENLENRVDRIEKELAEIKTEQKKLKEAVEELIKPEYVKNEDDLIKKLKMEWVRERKPVVSDKLREKIEEAIKYVKKGEKVCIIGEAGVGKTTALYLACRDLMKEGTKLRISGIKEEEGVFVVDNIGAKKDTLKKLENCTTPVIASARKSEWENPGRWHEIRIEIEDQRPKLREMFVSMLNANNVKYTEDVVDDILKRFFLPMYLYYIANDFKGREITKKDVSKFPEDVYVYRAEAIRDSRDDLAIALLYCVAKTRTGWLCETQLDILGEILKERIPGLKGDGEYERLLAKFDGSFGIIHEIDRDLMMGKDIPKEATSIIENIGAIRRMRAYDVEKFTKEACARSLNHIGYMDLSATVELMERALENFPDLMKKARKMAEKDKRLLPDLATTLNNLGVALYDKGSLDEAIDKLEEALKIRRDLAEKDEIFLPDLAMTLGILEIVLYDKGSPDKTIERLEDVLKIRRDLAEKDEKFLPDLAGTLNSLGNALYDKGMLDEAVDKLEEALKIRRDLAEKDKRFLPYLATTLNGLETVLYSILNEAVDKLEEDEAIDKLEEALKIRRDLAEKDEIFLPNLAETLNNLGLALYKKGMLDEAMERYDEALKAMEPLSGMPWLWNLISRIHINIAVILLMKNDEKGAAEHLCATLKMLTDERAPKTYDSENLLKTCISYLKGIPKELIPEECRRKLI